VTIHFLDLKAATDELRPSLDAAWRRVAESGWFVLGREVEDFERAYAAYVGARYCVGVANGLDALHLVLKAWGLGPGDEVIVPSNTYIATWLAVSQTGALPVPVEPNEETFNLDPERVEAAVTPKTRAVLPVHLYGHPADLEPLRALAQRRGLRLLEDGAQAHGAALHGRRIGSHGAVVAWSFYPGKNLGALGDGGAITTDDDRLAEDLRRLRNYGSRVKYVNEIQGYNSRLDELQAAFLSEKLKVLDDWNGRRQAVAQRYAAGLGGLPLRLPTVAPDASHAWHLYVVRTPARDALQKYLASLEIQTLIHYPVPPHLQLAYAALNLGSGSFPISERMHREVLSLPMGPHLDAAQQGRVIEAVRRYFGQPG
jgi:dTDP-4-amino-4,6-dideoxygalactose transaminase